ncbi:MAG: hypothetical protein ACTSQI_12670 [Candidatus Helarchaeota archaeon]
MGYELEKHLETIFTYLGSEDIGNQVMALKSFEHAVSETSLTQKQIEPFLKLIKERLEDINSPIRTDLIRTACLLGKHNFLYIKDIYPTLSNELTTKNRFRMEIVLDLIEHLANANLAVVTQTVKDIMANWQQWFSEPYLVPQFQNFLDRLTAKGFKFISNNEKELVNLVAKLPESLSVLKDLIDGRIQNYHAYLASEARKRAEEERERKQREEKKRRRAHEWDERWRAYENKHKKTQEDLEEETPGIPEEKKPIEPPKLEEPEKGKPFFQNLTDFGLMRKETSENDEGD